MSHVCMAYGSDSNLNSVGSKKFEPILAFPILAYNALAWVIIQFCSIFFFRTSFFFVSLAPYKKVRPLFSGFIRPLVVFVLFIFYATVIAMARHMEQLVLFYLPNRHRECDRRKGLATADISHLTIGQSNNRTEK